MASAHILILRNGNKPHTTEILALVGAMRDAKQRAERMKAVFDQIALGDDWASLATALDITSTQAETVYNLLSSLQDDVNTADYEAFIDRLG